MLTKLESGAELSTLFGPLPVLRSEDRKAYEWLRKEFLACLHADDIVKIVVVEGLVNDVWQLKRYELHQTLAIERTCNNAMAFQLQRKKVQAVRNDSLAADLSAAAVQKPNDVAELARLARRMIEAAVSDVDDLAELTPAELDHNRAFERGMAFIEQLERLKVSASKRFEQRLQLLEDYSEGFGQRLRKVAEDFLDLPVGGNGKLELPSTEAPSVVPAADADAKEDE